MMRQTILLPVFAAMAPLLLSGCGLSPVYQGGTQGAVAQRLGGIAVEPIPGRAGWLLRNALVDRLGTMDSGGQSPRYRLTITLDQAIEGLGVRANDVVTRERLSLRARYQLRDAGAAPDEAPILDRSIRADAGIDVVSSEYATVAAEDSAVERLAISIADRMVAQLALHAGRRATADE